MKRLPTWMAGVVMAVMFAVFWFAAGFITTPELGFGARALLSVSVGAFYGIFMGLWLSRMRRSYGRVAQGREFSRAVRRGIVPSDVDIEPWRRALHAHQRQYRPLRWAGPALYVPMTALAIWLAVTGQPLFWVGAALFLGVGIFTAITTPRVLRNTTSMLHELDRRDAVQRLVQ